MVEGEQRHTCSLCLWCRDETILMRMNRGRNSPTILSSITCIDTAVE